MAEMDFQFQSDVGSSSGAAQSHAEGVKGMARKKVLEKVDEQKSMLTSSLEKFADSIEQAGEGMKGPEAQIASKVADYVRKAHGMIDGKSTEDLVDTAIRGVRERPAAVIAGAFVLGFIGARLIKS